MALRRRQCASRGFGLLAAAGVMALAGCGPDGQPDLIAAQPRGASVAFESIDGAPPDKFRKLVDDLNEEAQTRRLAVASREGPSAYRVRGYLAAKTTKRDTTVSWVWDVFDGEQHRALRITGQESVKGRQRDAWAAADDAMLQRIARSSMDQLAVFLTSPEVAPNAPAAAPVMAAAAPGDVALIGARDSSPEAAGIFRIFAPQADTAPPPGAAVPLPRPRPTTTISSRETVTLAAARR